MKHIRKQSLLFAGLFDHTEIFPYFLFLQTLSAISLSPYTLITIFYTSECHLAFAKGKGESVHKFEMLTPKLGWGEKGKIGSGTGPLKEMLNRDKKHTRTLFFSAGGKVWYETEYKQLVGTPSHTLRRKANVQIKLQQISTLTSRQLQ